MEAWHQAQRRKPPIRNSSDGSGEI